MLNIGINLGFGKLHEDLTDEQMYDGEISLAVKADELGYDSVWATEHHFTDYSLIPDNFLVLAHIAGQTKQIGLGTAAVIVPWNDPLRVAEKALMLDNLSKGRMLLGLGRGVARVEFEGLRSPRDESRGRFDEGAKMIFDAIESGVIEGDGPHYEQPRAELRPVPRTSFDGRRYAVAGSLDSIISAVDLKASLMSFVVKPVPKLMENFNKYRELYEQQHGEIAPPICLNVNMYCHENAEVARERHFEYIHRFYQSNVDHYEFGSPELSKVKGYERYAENAKRLDEVGVDGVAEAYAESALYGTPEQILSKIEEIRDVLGDFELVVAPAFGGMPYEQAHASMELFAREVLPKARSINGAPISMTAAV